MITSARNWHRCNAYIARCPRGIWTERTPSIKCIAFNSCFDWSSLQFLWGIEMFVLRLELELLPASMTTTFYKLHRIPGQTMPVSAYKLNT